MEISEVRPTDKPEVISLLMRAQAVTGIPSTKDNMSELLEMNEYLYKRPYLEQYAARCAGTIIGHYMLQMPEDVYTTSWIKDTMNIDPTLLLQIDACFIDPMLPNGDETGIDLIAHAVRTTREIFDKIPVCAVRYDNERMTRYCDGQNEKRVSLFTRGDNSKYRLYTFNG